MTPAAEGSIILVTGLPRSGTSLMMQMLARGGVPVLADAQRAPDEDNPRGYFELAAVKSIARDASWLPRARGRAVKIVAPLLCHLLPGERYAAIWMERDLDEVMASQATLLERAGGRARDEDEAVLRRAFERLVREARNELEQRGAAILSVQYAQAIADPEAVARRLASFLGSDLDVLAAVEAVDPLLYRHRSI